MEIQQIRYSLGPMGLKLIMLNILLSYDVASEREITPCIKIDKPLFLHGNSLREAV